MDDLNAPATKGDVANAVEQVRSEINQLRSETNHGYNDIVERIHDTQTQLLRAFYDFAQTDARSSPALRP